MKKLVKIEKVDKPFSLKFWESKTAEEPLIQLKVLGIKDGRRTFARS